MAINNLILTDEDCVKLRESLKARFSVGVHELVFHKADGSVRVLQGTRDSEIIDPSFFARIKNKPLNEDGTPRKEPINSLAVFDVESQQWRSFSFSKLIAVDSINIDTIVKQSDITLEV